MSGVSAIDRAIFDWVIGHRVGLLDAPMWLLSQAADAAILWGVLALVLAATKRIGWSGFAQVLAAVGIASMITSGILKPLVNRTRPLAVDAADLIGTLPGSPSFPSGHATNAFAAATVLAALLPRFAPALWILAAAVAFSRVYLGVHYPLDITAGALIGVAVGTLVRAMVPRHADDATPTA